VALSVVCHALYSGIFLGEFVMVQFSRFATLLPATLLVCVVGLAGCAGMTQQEKGTATGAVIGGVAANVLCGGVLCTGAGAAVGGVIGHEVTKPK
jgi:osmotically inducible lipoprotein OsmB